MKMIKRTGTGMAIGAVVLAVAAGCAEHRPPVTPLQNAPRQSAAEPATAKEILQRMAGYLAKTPQFSVGIAGSYEVLQESGQKIEFAEQRKVTVSRPNGLRVEVAHSDGEKHLLLYDGKTLTAFSPSQNVYAQADKSGGIDAAVIYLLQDLHMRLPLAAMLLARLPEELERRTESLAYVEKTSIHGQSSHHLAGRTETVDYQIWIAEGAQPLPLRVVLTYKNAAGQPEYRAQFVDWNLQPVIRESLFAFATPEKAQKIAFAAQLPRIAVTETPENTGGSK